MSEANASSTGRSRQEMNLFAGTRLGPYEILNVIGIGGMGEVYRATDTRLHRDVAIKISAEQFTERFEREARAVAALNHPNICTLHDVGPNYLVMELVEGLTLAERMQQGPIALEESLSMARQIAGALEAAHEKGIIHRDLKPANIKITPGGTVKVLDFGLAKMADVASDTVTSTDNSPTLIVGTETSAGVILGTAAYMSPEQARGTAVDKRADIWAFGVVLYQMISGRRLFDGESASDIVAAVLTKDPDWDQVPQKTQRLLRSCLEKNPRHRLRDIGDAWRLLEPAPETRAPKSARLWVVATLLLILMAAVAMFGWWRTTRSSGLPPQTLVRLDLDLGPGVSMVAGSGPAAILSPDGTRLVFVSQGSDGMPRLVTRRLDEPQTAQLQGTDGAYAPFFSPDGQWVGFFARGKLKKTRVERGPANPVVRRPVRTRSDLERRR